MKLYRQAVREWIHDKLFKYRTAGVREYWIVDSLKNRITVYNFEEDTMQEYTFSEDIPAGIYQGKLTINLSNIQR